MPLIFRRGIPLKLQTLKVPTLEPQGLKALKAQFGLKGMRLKGYVL